MFNYHKIRRIKPMLAQKGTEAMLSDPDYVAQTKFDGTAILVIKDGNRIVLRGRSWKNDFAKRNRYPEIVDDLRKSKIKRFVGHAELTFYNEKTRKEKFFTALASPETRKGYRSMLEMHDLLYLNNRDIKHLGYCKRMEILGAIIPSNLNHVEAAKVVSSRKAKRKLWKKSLREKREGIMLKRKDAPYEEGQRSKNVLKLKKIYTERYDTADVVVVGVTKGRGRREKNFGALILAQKDSCGSWRFVGKTSGFSDSEQKHLLKKLRKQKSDRPHVVGRTPKNILFWTKPKTVVEIKYHEKQRGYSYRFPAFIRERPDKNASECYINARHRKSIKRLKQKTLEKRRKSFI